MGSAQLSSSGSCDGKGADGADGGGAAQYSQVPRQISL